MGKSAVVHQACGGGLAVVEAGCVKRGWGLDVNSYLEGGGDIDAGLVGDCGAE